MRSPINSSTLFALPLLALTVLALPQAVRAQDGVTERAAPQVDPMAVAEEVARFDKLLGNWEGEGQVWMVQGAEPSQWTATSSAKKVLGGHFVQEDTRIELGEGAPAPLVFRAFYGFDKAAGKWMSYTAGNLDGVMKAEVHWIDGKMVSATLGKAEGKLQIERWASTFAADSYSFSGYQATGNDRPFLHVKGKFTRVKAAPAAAAATAGLGKAKSFGPVPEEMAVLTKGAGTYRIKGWMIMDPSMPKTDIGATEVIGSVFGGAGVEFALSGDPIPGMGKYEGWGMIAWNAEEKCYKHLWLDNMGMAKIVDGHHRNGALIMINASLMMGQPIANRSVLKFDAAGNFASLEEHRLLGELPPMHCFSATYARQ